jgi:hypothetical protein
VVEEEESRRDFEPLELRATVTKDSEKELKGQYLARISPDGLYLLKGKKEVLQVPVGVQAEHMKGNQMAVNQGDRRVQLSLFSWGWYPRRLTRDVAAFLNGELEGLDRAAYKMPWYLLLPALPPLGIPIMTLGGAIPGAIGVGLAAACFGIMQQEEWPTAARVVLCLVLSVLGYLGVIALAVFLHTSNLLGR